MSTIPFPVSTSTNRVVASCMQDNQQGKSIEVSVPDCLAEEAIAFLDIPQWAIAVIIISTLSGTVGLTVCVLWYYRHWRFQKTLRDEENGDNLNLPSQSTNYCMYSPVDGVYRDTQTDAISEER
jgi:hypothetical protein